MATPAAESRGAVSPACQRLVGRFFIFGGSAVLLSLHAAQATIVVAEKQVSLVRRSGRGLLLPENRRDHAYRKNDHGPDCREQGIFPRSSRKVRPGRDDQDATERWHGCG